MRVARPIKTFTGFDVAASVPHPPSTTSPASNGSMHQRTCAGRPRPHQKAPRRLAAGHAAVDVGNRVRYRTAAELVETLYRGMPDNSIGRVIGTLLRNDVVFSSTRPAPSCSSASSRPPQTAHLGIALNWPFRDWDRFLPGTHTAPRLLHRPVHHRSRQLQAA